MPKININGTTREMTAAEVAEMELALSEAPAPEPSNEERMNEIEAALIELAAMMTGGM